MHFVTILCAEPAITTAMTERVVPAHVLAVPRWTLIIHIVQAALAIVILGLSAYGVHWFAYPALSYALAVVRDYPMLYPIPY